MALPHSCRRRPWGNLLCGLILALAGCESLGAKKFENPVAGPPPRRVRLDAPEAKPIASSDPDGETESQADSDVERTQYTAADNAESDVAAGGEVAVVVNGEPIFVDEILDGLPPEAQAQISAIRRKSTPEEFAVQRRRMAKMAMQPFIERTVLVQALREGDKPEKIKAILKVLDTHFAEYEKKLYTRLGVSTRSELQVKLREQGTSLETLRRAFQTDQMARYYMSQKAPEPKKPDRAELLAWYEEHLPEYTVPGQVRWQHIVLNHSRKGGPEKSRRLAGQLLQQLEAGADFGELAKKHSDGSTAGEGGVWDWTREGSLASKDVEAQLFALAEGEISAPIERKDTIEIVRVLERKEGGRKPFDQVQHEIEKQLIDSAQKGATGEIIQQLVEQAEITVMLDEST